MAYHKTSLSPYDNETTEEESTSSHVRSKGHVQSVPYEEKVNIWLSGVSYTNTGSRIGTISTTSSTTQESSHKPDYEPQTDRQKFSKLLDGISGVANNFPSRPYPAKKLYDRQGLLAGGAQTLGTLSDLRICPYVESHEVSESKFRKHVLKCRQANPAKACSVIVCQYNASHHIPIEIYNEHLQVCWDAKEAFARQSGNLPICPKLPAQFQK